MKEYISIFKPKIARRLLKMGNPIYDIKADKENSDRTIFIFKNNALNSIILNVWRRESLCSKL